MTCRELTDFIIDYLGDELPVDMRASFELHLGACLSCRCYLDQYAASVAAGRMAFDDPLPAMPEELIRAILAARRA